MYKLLTITLTTLCMLIATPAIARRGCCSWHGGVNRCDRYTYRIICNDGTYSKSCMCEAHSKNKKFRY